MAGTYAVIGDPIEHSMSPLIHNAAFRELGIDSSYIAYKVGSDELKDGVESLKVTGFAGFNVTIPHKVNVLKYLDEYDDNCHKVGAANTVTINDGKLYGYNTDIDGFLEPLLERKIDVAGLDVLLLGAGGAARAIVVALAKCGASSITIANRTLKSIDALSKIIDADTVVHTKSLDDAPMLAKKSSLIVNATALGLNGEQSPISAEFMNADQIVYDIVYKPMKTRLLAEAAKAGAIVIHGYEMLLGQACGSFQIWNKKQAPKEAMKRAILGGF